MNFRFREGDEEGEERSDRRRTRTRRATKRTEKHEEVASEDDETGFRERKARTGEEEAKRRENPKKD